MADRLKHDVPNRYPDTAEVPVPHGPDTRTHQAYLPAHDGIDTAEEDRILAAVLKPNDSYDFSTESSGIYWADLNWRRRFQFVNGQFWTETRDELRNLRSVTTLRRPWALFSIYARNSVLPGAGLGLEGYILFSIGNLAPLFASKWPECWDKHGSQAACQQSVVATVTYLEVLGIMVGQVLVGFIGDKIGRRWGLVQDALIMGVGLLLLTAAWAPELQGFVIFYAVSLFVYGIGVGGEYPMTATSSMENAVGAGRVSTREDRMHRGRKVTLAFLMQGIGQFVNILMLLFLLAVSNGGSLDPPYQDKAVHTVFRVSVGVIAPPTFWLAWYRYKHMKGASRQLEIARRHGGQGVTGYSVESTAKCCNHFGGRLIATAGTWFCNDVFFYGNKLFVGAFINVVSANSGSDKGVSATWQWNLCNIAVSLAGYYLAAFVIDHKAYGRKNMQAVGFLACFLFVVIPAYKYKYFTEPAHIHAFMAMYFLSSFFNQFGPNSVTFLVAAEVFPTPVRASAHGFSACVGKAGALLSAVLFNYLDTETCFKFVSWWALAGLVLNQVFMPDTTGLDLKEQERRWRYIMDGRGEEYRGIAVHPRHLSRWERLRGVAKQYNADLDYKQRQQDLRDEWERNEAEKARIEPESTSSSSSDLSDEEFPPQVHEYFKRTQGQRRHDGKSPDKGVLALSSSSEDEKKK